MIIGVRERLYAALNTFGLALGLAVCTILFLVVRFALGRATSRFGASPRSRRAAMRCRGVRGFDFFEVVAMEGA